ncbi:MAG TPA: serine protease [Solirubrobacteraceae bacterium]
MLKTRHLAAGLLTIAAACATTTPAGAAPTGPAPIAGGTDVANGAYPFVAGLRRVGNTRFFCTGTLIRKDWVLTAGHCVDGATRTQALEVRLGQNDLDVTAPLAETRAIDRVVIHPDWGGDAGDKNDVALLHLSAPSGITPARLGRPASVFDGITRCNKPQYFTLRLHNLCVATGVKIFGWGRTPATGDHTSRRLQTTTGPLFSRKKSGQFWVAKLGACKGDSGGPMLAEQGGRDHRLTLIGVASYITTGSGWCDRDGRDFYSDVTTGTSLYTWINMRAQPPTPGNPPQGPACNPTKPNCHDPE